jgi:hypothetical protein
MIQLWAERSWGENSSFKTVLKRIGLAIIVYNFEFLLILINN